MAFLNLFKKKGKAAHKIERKKPDVKKKPAKPVKKKAVQPADLKSEKKPIEPKAKFSQKRLTETAPRVFRSPHITEKATKMEDNNDYIFKVASASGKSEIKKAVEDFYGVKVLGVRIINVPRKSKRLGKTKGFKQGYKKAIVRVKKGQTIELMPR